MAATGTGAGLARVVDDSFFIRGGKDFCTEGCRAAREDLGERLAYSGAGVVPIPRLPSHAQDLLKRLHAHVGHRPFSGAGLRSTPG